MRYIRTAIFCTPLILGACAVTLPEGITDPEAGFEMVATRTQAITGNRSVWLQNSAQTQEIADEVHALTHQRTISADTAVQVALLNNRGLQAACI